MRTWPAIDVERLNTPDLLHAALTDYAVSAIDERAPDSWVVYFHTVDERNRAATSLRTAFPDLHLEPVDVPDEDWARRSQAALRAIRVGNVVVAPPWDVPAPGAGNGARSAGRSPTLVVIQPSMGFGTGHHATTRLCLDALQQFDLKGRTVLDVGTGSGVLAIAAALLGAAHVIAIDDDPDAMASARENVDRNGVIVDCRVGDFRSSVLGRFDLVLANLTGPLLVQSARRLQDLTAHRGPLILSGFLHHEEAAVLAAFASLRPIDRNQEDEWVCVTLQRDGAFE